MNPLSQINHVNNSCFVILVYDTSMKISPYLLSLKIILSDTTSMQEKKSVLADLEMDRDSFRSI